MQESVPGNAASYGSFSNCTLASHEGRLGGWIHGPALCRTAVELAGPLPAATLRVPLTCSTCCRTEQLTTGVGSSAWQVVSSVSISNSNTSPVGRCGDTERRSEQCIALFLQIRPKCEPPLGLNPPPVGEEKEVIPIVSAAPPSSALPCGWDRNRASWSSSVVWAGAQGCLPRRRGHGLGQIDGITLSSIWKLKVSADT